METTISNKSIKQINYEIHNAKREALRRPHRFEVENFTCAGDGDGDNLLSDVVMVKQLAQRSGTQSLAHLKDKIERIFKQFPVQYDVLGLYHGSGFTLDEIAVMRGDSKGNVRTTLKRAVARLKKYLSPEEFGSITWALGIRPVLHATPRVDDSEYDNCRSRFAPMKNNESFTNDDHIRTGYVPSEKIIFWDDLPADTGWEHVNQWRRTAHVHPPEKNLPVPRMVIWKEQQCTTVPRQVKVKQQGVQA